MKNLVFFICFSSPLFAQENLQFLNKKEVIIGVNYSGFWGLNAGYSSRIQQKFYYRLDAQYTKRYYINTNSDNFDNFWYNDLTVNSIVLNNMFSRRFYQKRHDRFYFELGAYLGINLLQEKKGQTYNYNLNQTKDFNKLYYFLPNDLGMHIGCGIRASKYFLFKPEIRFGILTFDKLFEDSGFLDEMMRNAKISLNFNLSYLF